MSDRSDDLYLVDIIESADYISKAIEGLDYDSFAHGEREPYAVLWKIFILTEAANRMSQPTRDKFGDVPWGQIKAFRNRMAHGYFTLELPRIWEVVCNSVPALAATARSVLKDSFPETYQALLERKSGRKS